MNNEIQEYEKILKLVDFDYPLADIKRFIVECTNRNAGLRLQNLIVPELEYFAAYSMSLRDVLNFNSMDIQNLDAKQKRIVAEALVIDDVTNEDVLKWGNQFLATLKFYTNYLPGGVNNASETPKALWLVLNCPVSASYEYGSSTNKTFKVINKLNDRCFGIKVAEFLDCFDTTEIAMNNMVYHILMKNKLF